MFSKQIALAKRYGLCDFFADGPEFTSNSSSIIACRPQRPIIRCVADGFPVPAVRVMFLNTEKVRGHGEVTHVITDLADSTFGVYTCLANNTVKKVNITRTLVKKGN